MKKKDYIDIFVIAGIFIIITALFMSFEVILNIDTESQWIGFYGNLFGGLLGAIIALRIMKRQIEEERVNIDINRVENYKMDLEICVTKEVLCTTKALKQALNYLYDSVYMYKRDEEFNIKIKDIVPTIVRDDTLDTDKISDEMSVKATKQHYEEFRAEFEESMKRCELCYENLENVFDTYRIILLPEVEIELLIVKKFNELIENIIKIMKLKADSNEIFNMFNEDGVDRFNNLVKVINIYEYRIQTRVLGKLFNREIPKDILPRYKQI